MLTIQGIHSGIVEVQGNMMECWAAEMKCGTEWYKPLAARMNMLFECLLKLLDAKLVIQASTGIKTNSMPWA
jgi:hypothetical protein